MAAQEHQITCITQSGGSTHQHITHVGNSSQKWTFPKADVITKIEAKTHAFFVKDNRSGKVSYVGVVRETGQAPYLRTYADSTYNNNLLAQVACSLN